MAGREAGANALPSAKSRRSRGPASPQNGADPNAGILRHGSVTGRMDHLVAPSCAQGHEGNDPPQVLQMPGTRHKTGLAESINRDARACESAPAGDPPPGTRRLARSSLPISPEQQRRYCKGDRYCRDRGQITFHGALTVSADALAGHVRLSSLPSLTLIC